MVHPGRQTTNSVSLAACTEIIGLGAELQEIAEQEKADRKRAEGNEVSGEKRTEEKADGAHR